MSAQEKTEVIERINEKLQKVDEKGTAFVEGFVTALTIQNEAAEQK